MTCDAKREGVDVKSFASSIRLQTKLDQNGLSEEHIESWKLLLEQIPSLLLPTTEPFHK